MRTALLIACAAFLLLAVSAGSPDTEIPATATNAVDAAPKVFISHAGEDRERFAKPFAARLRANGVDAWISFWEINPGDSIVDRIFNEEIGRASCRERG